MDLQTIFSTNNRAKTVVKQGTAIVSNTMLIMDKLDVKGFKACVYGYDNANNALYIKLTNNVDKSEKHSDIQKSLYVAKIRLNIAKGLGLEPKANKEVKLEPVKDQTNTYKLQLA